MKDRFTGLERGLRREFMTLTFLGESVWEEEGNWTFCKAINKNTVPYIDMKDSNKGIYRYTLTKEPLMKYLENRKNMQSAKARAAMGVGLGWNANEV